MRHSLNLYIMVFAGLTTPSKFLVIPGGFGPTTEEDVDNISACMKKTWIYLQAVEEAAAPEYIVTVLLYDVKSSVQVVFGCNYKLEFSAEFRYECQPDLECIPREIRYKECYVIAYTSLGNTEPLKFVEEPSCVLVDKNETE